MKPLDQNKISKILGSEMFPYSGNTTASVIANLKRPVRVSIIVAYAKNRVIGSNGKIPWHLPEDIEHFKNVTATKPVIMGRKTWDSIPEKYKPLSGRLNIVITREEKPFPSYYDPKEPYWAKSLEYAVRLAKVTEVSKEIFIIGGAQIYQEALDKGLVNRIVASELREEFEGDAFFPVVDWPSTVIKEYDDFVVKEFLKPVSEYLI